MAKVEQVPSGSIGQQTLGKHLLGDSQIIVLPAATYWQRAERIGGVIVSNRSPILGFLGRKHNCLQHGIAIRSITSPDWTTLPATVPSGDYYMLCDKTLACIFQQADVTLQGHSFAGSTFLIELFVAGYVDFFSPDRFGAFVDPGDFSVGGPLPDGQIAQIHTADVIQVPMFPANLFLFKTWYLRLHDGPTEVTDFSVQLS